MSQDDDRPAGGDLAIIGIACRFPGACDYRQFWRNLAAGTSSIGAVPPDRWGIDHYSPRPDEPGKAISHWGGFLDRVDEFDARFFRISPREASNMDPQQRLLLEEAWRCVEDSGVALAELRRAPTSVFVGVMTIDYYQTAVAPGVPIDAYAGLGNYECILANRISHVLGLSGMSLALDTACSSSLVALHEARKSLIQGESDYALVAAVSLNLHPWKYISFSKARMLSPDGRCKTFDKDADGYVPSEGVGVLLVQRLRDALRDGNHVYGLLKGSAVNHCGGAASITAPRVEAQRDLILAALAAAGVGAETVGYVEAHGTGTSLGDPVEVEALTQAFRRHTDRTAFCKLGAVKTNIGHLEAAAGLAGVIKVLLMMQHGQIPATLNVRHLNPLIRLEETPFELARTPCAWEPTTAGVPLRAGVSSFGFGGVNAHVVLESLAPQGAGGAGTADAAVPFALSAKTRDSLRGLLDQWESGLRDGSLRVDDLGDVCATLLAGRESFPLRGGALVRDRTDVERALADARRSIQDLTAVGDPAPALLLRLGRVDAIHWSGFDRLLSRDPALRASFERLRPNGSAARLGDRAAVIAARRALAGRLIDIAGPPAAIVCGEPDVPEALALAGADLAPALGGSFEPAPTSPPRVPVVVPGASLGFGPFRIDASYLRLLRDSLAADDRLLTTLRRDAWLLWNSQPTFTKFLDEWEEPLGRASLGGVRALLEDAPAGAPTAAAQPGRNLALAILAASFRRVNAKWSLSEQHPIGAELGELADLLIDGVLTHRDVIALLAPAGDDFDAVARRAGGRSGRIDPGKPYGALRRHARDHQYRLHDGGAILPPGGAGEAADGPGVLLLDIGDCAGLTTPGRAVAFDPSRALEDGFARALLDLWLGGAVVSWREFVPTPYRKVSLPGSVFDRGRFWLPTVGWEAPAPGGGVTPDGPPCSPGAESSSRRVFSVRDPIIRGHAIAGRPLLPAALIVEMALEAARRATGAPTDTLADLFFLRPGVVDGDLEVTLTLDRPGRAFELAAGEGVLCRGCLVPGGAPGGGTAPPREWDGGTTIAGAAIYQALRGRGYDYGEPYRVIRDAWRAEDRVVFALEGTHADEGAVTGFDPYLLDGAFQAAAWLHAEWGDGAARDALAVPARIGSLSCRELRGRCFAVAWKRDYESRGHESLFNIELFDARSRPVAEIRRLALRAPRGDRLEERPTMAESTAPAMPGGICYQPAWSPRPLAVEAAAPEGGTYLVVHDGGALGLALAERVRQDGGAPIRVVAGPNFEPIGASAFQIRAGEQEDYVRVIDGLARHPGLAAAWPLEVFVLLPLETPAAARPEDGLLPVFLLAKAIARRDPTRPVRLTVVTRDAQTVLPGDAGSGYPHGGLEALAETIALEVPRLHVRIIDLGGPGRGLAETAAAIVAEHRAGAETLVAYRAGGRHVRALEPLPPAPPRGAPALADGRTYLVAGGAGAIGAQVARAIATRARARLVLVGRSPLDDERRALVEELRRSGAGADYLQADVGEPGEVERLVRAVKQLHGPIHGVIHCCGILDDALLVNKDPGSFRRVFRSKAASAYLLDQQTGGEPLEFFVVFSSVVAVFGNIGQADYATANGWLDGFMRHRARGGRPGRSLTINWPLWIDGGMGTDERVRQAFRVRGLDPLPAGRGVAIFLDLLGRATGPQVVVAARDLPDARPEARHHPPPRAAAPEGRPRERAQREQELQRSLIELLSKKTQLDARRISLDESFFAMGVESLMLDEIMTELGRRYGNLSPTLLFDRPNIRELTRSLLEREPSTAEPAAESGVDPDPAASDGQVVTASGPWPVEAGRGRGYDIAVIGMHGRFPKAPDLDAFWENLRAARDCIEEVPPGRWNHRAYFDVQKRPDRSYGKWGGFLEDVDCFDPLFFNIAPRDAELMDPQQRLFLECVWKTMEDAGYASRRSYRGRRVGLFVGVMWNEYTLHSFERGLSRGAYGGPGSLYWAIANRVSYFMDFRGPSLAVDTACSSSLVALHLACQGLLAGDCELAVAGGVNLSLHPFKYIYLSQSNFLSTDGRCRSFGEGGDGYVPGEGVGAVLLKPLARALADGDHVLAVIRGTATNHGGRATGFTVPNGDAQAELIEETLRRAGVSADRIDYVECHGTGTALGDPIEINALARVFGAAGGGRGDCLIDSVKSNIGHLEAAAGIAGVIKVLLCMRHGLIPESLHSRTKNRRIDFDAMPFRVVDRMTEWPRVGGPRLAAISSFGAGGSNAHAILEAYDRDDRPAAPTDPGEEVAILLSAKTPERLRALAEEFRDFLGDAAPDGAPAASGLREIAYTLQVGREPLEERLAIVCRSREELVAKLDDFVGGRAGAPGIYWASPKTQGGAGPRDETDPGRIDAMLRARRVGHLAGLWVAGAEIDWAALYPPGSARRVPLPTYPFARERYWIPEAEGPRPAPMAAPAGAAPRADGRSRRLLVKDWVEAPPPSSRPDRPLGTFLLLLDRENEEEILRGFGPPGAARFLSARRGERYRRTSETRWELDFGSVDDARRAAREILAACPDLDGVFDLADLTDGAESDRAEGRCEVGRLALLQGLIEGRYPAPLRALHLTRGSKPWLVERPGLAGAWIAGLYPVLAAEYRNVRAQSIDVDVGPRQAGAILEILGREPADDAFGEVCYRSDRRYRPRWLPIEFPAADIDLRLDPGKVYVITGGTRGIGAEVARYLVRKGATRLVLMGLQPLPPRQRWPELLGSAARAEDRDRRKIELVLELERSGAAVRLDAGPLTDAARLSWLFADVVGSLGPIGGVIHCAGVAPSRSAAFLKRDLDDVRAVLEPKVDGLATLFAATPVDQLDFFALFSSVSAAAPALGVGVSDYACANAFLDAFAAHHHARGLTAICSINWPSWREAGVGEFRSRRTEDLGFDSLGTAEALDLLDAILRLRDRHQVLPCIVDPDRFRPEDLCRIDRGRAPQPVAAPEAPASLAATESAAGAAGRGDVTSAARRWLVGLLSRELKIAQERIDGVTDFSEYGVDSILLAELVRAIEIRIGSSLDPSVLLEHQTIDRLAAYLGASFAGAFEGEEVPPADGHPRHQAGDGVAQAPGAEGVAGDARLPATRADGPRAVAPPDEDSRIAVIGIGCQFPGAEGVDRYWENLIGGVCNITEVPRLRWDAERLYSPTPRPGKSISRWGGFLEGIEWFDPDYFGITGVDPMHIDPLERQFLEACARAMGDAGYEAEELARLAVGVFAGARVGNYARKIETWSKHSIVGVGQNFIAAHASKLFGLRGPNLVVDTACSSSLVAIHLACQSLRLGECAVALAGGVEILLDEQPYLLLSEAMALAPDGLCRAFDSKANGFVPGEGAGVVVLKPLPRAATDGDRIYAVIDGSAVNNDGRTMGTTTPGLQGQQSVIEEALTRARVDPDEVGCIEAHGTGTMIGDPIELKALTTAFRRHSQRLQYCAIGSVKSNIGHTLSAAGVAGFIKVALALRHRMIPPTLHCDEPNRRFDFERSPFLPNVRLRSWESRATRRAGISSFGFGGTNCHLLASEFDPSWYPDYLGRRRPLPPPAFRKRRYWPDGAESSPSAPPPRPDAAPAPPPPLLAFERL